MARDIAKTVRIDEAQDAFIEHQAKQSYHAPTTLMYIIVKEWCDLHGIDEWKKDHAANLQNKSK